MTCGYGQSQPEDRPAHQNRTCQADGRALAAGNPAWLHPGHPATPWYRLRLAAVADWPPRLRLVSLSDTLAEPGRPEAARWRATARTADPPSRRARRAGPVSGARSTRHDTLKIICGRSRHLVTTTSKV